MKYKSEASKVLYENAVAMYKIGAITEASMREYDDICLKNPKKKKSVSSVSTNENPIKLKINSHATT